MKLAVLVKQVPGSESHLRLNTSGTWIEENSVTFEMNESDNYALEEALRIKESHEPTDVIVVSMGPDRVQKVIREALAKGADRAIHIKTDTAENIDPLTIADQFAKVLTEENVDLVFSGLQSDDIGSGQTGVILGELLNMTTATLVVETEMVNGSLKVKRELESGWFQWITLPLPASITIQSGINLPRYPSLKGIMGAKKKEIKEVEIPAATSRQTLTQVFIPHSEKKTVILEGSTEEIVDKLVEAFKTDIKIL